jgi:polyisoprenoid-binding protein YceI
MSRGIKIFIAAVAGLIVVAVAGAFIYARVDKAPKKLTLNTTTTEAGASATTVVAATGDIAGSWKPTSKSVVGYRVQETLFGAKNEAYGRTSNVTGSMSISGTTISAVDLTVDMASISSDRTQRDGQFRGRIMQTSQFPTATFKLAQPIVLSSVPTGQISQKATGQLTLHGVTKPVTLDIKAQRNGAAIEVNGSTPIKFADYGISDPSGGPAQAEDHGVMEFLVIFEKA